ncbi:MAG: DNA-binding response regulator, partial [Dechloromonas sp.]|nr:DNA-binding response regulator [Dechloromonas sp.]
MRILIVEDDPMIGASIRTGLRQDGYTADWARDGNSA